MQKCSGTGTVIAVLGFCKAEYRMDTHEDEVLSVTNVRAALEYLSVTNARVSGKYPGVSQRQFPQQPHPKHSVSCNSLQG